MIPSTNTRTVATNAQPLDQAGYSFDPRNMKHIAAILRDMYSNPPLAVVREYGANCVDAHLLAGHPMKPFEVLAPTLEEASLTFRDFGPGLSNDDVKRLLLGYGASGDEKRSSNKSIGGFGIGCKCAFAVTDQFTYVSFFNGMKSIWHCFRDQDDECAADLISEEPTTEPSGVMVTIPVRHEEVRAYQKVLESAFLFYTMRPHVLRAPPAVADRIARKLPAPFLAGNLQLTDRAGVIVPIRWEAVKDPDYSDKQVGQVTAADLSFARVVMGGIAYPIDLDRAQIEGGPSEAFFRRIILYAPIGSIDLVPNREQLKYTPRVINMLKGIFGEIDAQSSVRAVEALEKATSARERLDLVQSLSSSLSSLKDMQADLIKRFGIGLRGLCVPSYGPTVLREYTRKQIYNQKLGKYVWAWGMENLRPSNLKSSNIFISPDRYSGCATFGIIGLKDEDPVVSRDILAKVYPHAYPARKFSDQENSSITLVGFPDEAAAKHTWMLDGSVKVYTMDEVNALPAPPADVSRDFHNEQEEDNQAVAPIAPQVVLGGRTPNRPSSGYAQHSRKFLRLDLSKEATPRTVFKPYSLHWGPVFAKELEKTRKVYVYIDQFLPCANPKNLCSANHEAALASLRSLVQGGKFLPEAIEFRTSGLLAVRVREEGCLKGKSDFVHLWDYLAELYAAFKTRGLTDEAFREAIYYLDYSDDKNAGHGHTSLLAWATFNDALDWHNRRPDLVTSQAPFMIAVRGFKKVMAPLIGSPDGLAMFRHFVLPLYWLVQAIGISNWPDVFKRLGLKDTKYVVGKEEVIKIKIGDVSLNKIWQKRPCLTSECVEEALKLDGVSFLHLIESNLLNNDKIGFADIRNRDELPKVLTGLSTGNHFGVLREMNTELFFPLT